MNPLIPLLTSIHFSSWSKTQRELFFDKEHWYKQLDELLIYENEVSYRMIQQHITRDRFLFLFQSIEERRSFFMDVIYFLDNMPMFLRSELNIFY